MSLPRLFYAGLLYGGFPLVDLHIDAGSRLVELRTTKIRLDSDWLTTSCFDEIQFCADVIRNASENVDFRTKPAMLEKPGVPTQTS